MDLAKRYDLRFVIMSDRWNKDTFSSRSVEDLKDRYYKICGIIGKVIISTIFKNIYNLSYMLTVKGRKKNIHF